MMTGVDGFCGMFQGYYIKLIESGPHHESSKLPRHIAVAKYEN